MIVCHLAGCGPVQKLDRNPSTAELAHLERLLAKPSPGGWSAEGWLRQDGEDIEARIRVNVDGQARAKLWMRSEAAFGLVADGVTLVFPGDETLLVYHHKDAELEQLPIAESFIATLLPTAERRTTLALISACLPSGDALLPGDWRLRTRLVGQSEDRSILRFRVDLSEPGAYLILQLARHELESFEYHVGDHKRIRLEYSDYRLVGEALVASEVRIEAPQEGVKAHVRLEHLEPRRSWERADFEVF